MPSVNWSGASRNDRFTLAAGRELELCLVALTSCTSWERLEQILGKLKCLEDLSRQYASQGLREAAEKIPFLETPTSNYRRAAETITEQAKDLPKNEEVLKALVDCLESMDSSDRRPMFDLFQQQFRGNTLALRAILAGGIQLLPEEQRLAEFEAFLEADQAEEGSKAHAELTRDASSDPAREGSEHTLLLNLIRCFADLPPPHDVGVFSKLCGRASNRPGEVELLCKLAQAIMILPEQAREEAFEVLCKQASGKPGKCEVLAALAFELGRLPEERQPTLFHTLLGQANDEPGEAKVRETLVERLTYLPNADEMFHEFLEKATENRWTGVLVKLAHSIDRAPAALRASWFDALCTNVNGMDDEGVVLDELLGRLDSLPEVERGPRFVAVRNQIRDKPGEAQAMEGLVDAWPRLDVSQRTDEFHALCQRAWGKSWESRVLNSLAMTDNFLQLPKENQPEAFRALWQQAEGKPCESRVWYGLILSIACLPDDERVSAFDELLKTAPNLEKVSDVVGRLGFVLPHLPEREQLGRLHALLEHAHGKSWENEFALTLIKRLRDFPLALRKAVFDAVLERRKDRLDEESRVGVCLLRSLGALPKTDRMEAFHALRGHAPGEWWEQTELNLLVHIARRHRPDKTELNLRVHFARRHRPDKNDHDAKEIQGRMQALLERVKGKLIENTVLQTLDEVAAVFPELSHRLASRRAEIRQLSNL